MQRVKVRRAAQITLPPEVQRKLGVSEGDYLDIDELVETGVLLRPPPEARRRAASERIHKAQARVRYTGPEPRPSPEEEEERLIAEMLEADKPEEAAERGHE